jgi:hypothetical protein
VGSRTAYHRERYRRIADADFKEARNKRLRQQRAENPTDGYKRLLARNKLKRRRRSHWIGKYKEAKGCCICGYNKSKYALDFHHRDPSQKKFNASVRMFNLRLKTIIAEIRKCDIMCANCHRIESFGGGHCGI